MSSAVNSSQNALIVGNITNGRFSEVAPGTVTIQFALDEGTIRQECARAARSPW